MGIPSKGNIYHFMQTPPTIARDSDDFERVCTVCRRPAFTRYYGAVSCEACRMFFRRMIIEKLSYDCKKINNCYETSKGTRFKCRSCRFKRCLQMGMKLPPSNYTTLELKDNKVDELANLLNDLKLRDEKRCDRYMTFYTTTDPSLHDILSKNTMVVHEQNDHTTTTIEWSFLAAYNIIEYFTSFHFIDKLNNDDKMKLFQANSFRSNIFCGGMRGYKEKRDKMVTPGGQEILPDILVKLLNTSPQLLHKVCCQVIARLIELEITNEEFVLLNLIFFFNTVDSMSESAKSTLGSLQKLYTNALFQYCQLNYKHRAPSRLVDLLSLYQIVQKNTSEIQYIGIMTQALLPDFRVKKLVSDTYRI